MGCSVSCATNGEEALELLVRSEYDVMITDMLMLGLHGLEFLEQTQSGYPEMDTIVMTGYASEFPYVEVTKAGANDFIDKPFPPAGLEAKLIRIMEDRKLRGEHDIAQSKYRNLFEISMDGMLVLDREKYRLTDANRVFCKLTDRNERALLGLSIVYFSTWIVVIALRRCLTSVLLGGRGR